MPDPAPARIGRYEIIERLGRGGMGTVLLARDPHLDRVLAVKVLSIENDSDDARQRFTREARSAGALRHSNIVTIYDFGEDGGRAYIAMEYVDGESVAELVRRRAPLTLIRKLELVLDLCAGLAYAHKGGVIHRDIKPANLMLSADGVLKILDFGLARLRDAAGGLTQMGMLGTPHYLSPEQIMSRPIDQRSDIFSAGLVMYELLTYQRAFEGDSTAAVLHQIASTDAPSIRSQIPDVDPDLERIVAMALEREPDRRYQHAGALRGDLERLIARLKSAALLDGPTAAGHAGLPQAPPASKTPPVKRDAEALLRRRAAQVDRNLATAQARFDGGDYAAAMSDLENVLLLDPEEPRARELLARARDATEQEQVRSSIAAAREEVARGSLDTAITLLDHALQLRPGTQEALDLRREIQRQQQTADANRSLEREAAVRRALELARGHLAEGALEAASRAVGEALAFDPANPSALALKQEIADALAGHRPAAAVVGAPRAGEMTVVMARPDAAAPAAPLHEGTVFIPAGAATQGARQTRPGARLIVLQSGDPHLANRAAEVSESFEIGRAARDLSSSERTWSRRHAVIEYGEGGYTIRDLGSAGGTYVNGRRVRPDVPEPLLFGAHITIGSSLLTFAPSSDASLPDLTGAEVAGRYVLERLLRTSSKGAVYVARQKSGRLQHALKLLSPLLLAYPGYVQRFKREAEVAVDLHHPHICDVRDYGDTTVHRSDGSSIDTVFLCLRLMNGGNLADRLDGHQPIALADVTRWVDRLGEALSYAHSRGIVHGDLKPSAIVFDHEDTANSYLTDFAIGQPREGESGPGVIGTPAYMAPEQWEGAVSTPATDQFGLAALAYFMIAGVRPFEGQDHPEIRRRNFSSGPPDAHKEAEQHGREGVRPAVSRVLARALAYKADDRYATVADFTQDFVRALTGSASDRDPAASPRVFLSYQRAGGAGLPLFISSRLRDTHGIDVFLDVHRVDGAVKFPDRLAREMDQADVFVCLLGPKTLESRWVRHEIDLASRRHKPMIPVFHEDYDPPGATGADEVDELLSYDAIRLMDQQNLYVEEGIDKLARRVKDTLTRKR
jgi:serine/threonine-protein kinase